MRWSGSLPSVRSGTIKHHHANGTSSPTSAMTLPPLPKVRSRSPGAALVIPFERHREITLISRMRWGVFIRQPNVQRRRVSKIKVRLTIARNNSPPFGKRLAQWVWNQQAKGDTGVRANYKVLVSPGHSNRRARARGLTLKYT